jgi:spoIIIJ-associated protein
MENKVSEILENVLGLLMMEGSFEVNEHETEVEVLIETEDAGRLIGVRGESLDALQLMVNLMVSRQLESDDEYKRVIIDVSGWRKNKSEDLTQRAVSWAEDVKETGKEMELEPMPAWQRRVVHMAIQDVEGVTTESVGEGRDRHLVIKPGESTDSSTEDETASEPEATIDDSTSESETASESSTKE